LSSNISDKDKKDWESFLSKKEKLPNKDFKNSHNKLIKIKRYDLHGLSLKKANEKVDKLIKDSYEQGISKLILVTGKGLHSENEKDPYVSKDLAILKYSVPDYIRNNIELMKLIHEIKEASTEDGGSGAFYIFLKKFIK
jgi:DNA-nicking Smr family endonuclease